MRIGILTHNYPKTKTDRQNAGIFVYDFAQELSRQREVFVLCPNFDGKKSADPNIPVTWFEWMGGKEKLGEWKMYNPLSLIKFLNLIHEGNSATIQFIKENRIDLVVAMWAMPAAIWARHAKIKLKIPYITVSLGSDIDVYPKYPILRELIKSSLTEADERFAVSHKLSQKTAKLAGLDCQFLPIMTKFSLKNSKKIALSSDFNFLFVGRLEKVKGLDLLLEACKILLYKGKEFHVYILGTGSLQTYMIRTIAKHRLQSYITLFGEANLVEVGSYMKSSDCLVLSSRSEGLSLVIIEAAHARLPVITTDVGECGRNVRKYNLGLVAKEITPESIAQTMEKALTKGKGFGKEYVPGMKKITAAFSISHTVDLFLEKTRRYHE